MKQTLTEFPLLRLALVAAMLVNFRSVAYGQVVGYLPATENVQSNYLDLGTAGTAIATANTDDANSAPQPIGFSFSFNSSTFTEFVLNTNGLLRLGGAAPSTAAGFFTQPDNTVGGPLNSTDPLDTNLLLPFNHDLTAGTGPTEYRVVTTGAAPNRICTVQWKNVADKASGVGAPTQLINFSFQVRLYETTNAIEFAYGPAVAAVGGTIIRDKTVGVGLKGSGTAAGQLLTVAKSTSRTWGAAQFVAGFEFSTFSREQAPTAGRTLRFAVPRPNNAAVIAIFTKGRLPVPAATPHVVRAVVRNLGSAPLTNLAVTLSVTGAFVFSNTQTVSSLAPGASATVAFSAYTPTALGTNTLTVSLPADDEVANNTATTTQLVNTTIHSYAEPSVLPTGRAGFSTVASTNVKPILAIGMNATINQQATEVQAYLDDPNTVGQTLSGVVCGATGNILGRTAPYVVQASDIGTTKSFVFATPVPVPAGNYFAGVFIDFGGFNNFQPIGTQTENASRPGTYFRISTSGTIVEDIGAENLGRLMMYLVTAGTPTPTVAAASVPAVAVFPNPAHGSVVVDIQSAAAGELRAEVINALGQRLYQTTVRRNFRNELPLQNLTPGVYMLRVYAAGSTTAHRLVVE